MMRQIETTTTNVVVMMLKILLEVLALSDRPWQADQAVQDVILPTL